MDYLEQLVLTLVHLSTIWTKTFVKAAVLVAEYAQDPTLISALSASKSLKITC